MRMHWTEIAVASAVAGAGCVAVYAGLQRVLRRIVAERQQETDRQIAALTTTVRALQARVVELNHLALRRGQDEVEQIAAAAEGTDVHVNGEKPEVLAVITAAATAFLGKAARVRSARLVPAPQETVSAWSQQGRVIVHTSHNLRGRE